jgi:hypothetical protein
MFMIDLSNRNSIFINAYFIADFLLASQRRAVQRQASPYRIQPAAETKLK